jgi:hypothetical protein
MSEETYPLAKIPSRKFIVGRAEYRAISPTLTKTTLGNFERAAPLAGKRSLLVLAQRSNSSLTASRADQHGSLGE